ncbi:tetraspanin-1 [Tachysurus fulvidraco]|uniref:tetraspanin-1 n=1 Tax=Tachysurus fulvidraco TaxID=1234273 RepID=UPI000F4FBE3B|nr:tetraspanin-1 [Tachysurus fulvidraco]XP_047669071.1 tetraspanin-1 [Tachysurus fulvidraco]
MGFFEFAKVMMVVYNLLILMAGSGLMAAGFWVQFNGDVLGSSLLGVFSVTTVNNIRMNIFFIIVGIIMALLGILGCCGAKKESKCLLIMFFSIIAIIFISEVTIGIFSLIYSSYVGNLLKSWAKPVLQKQYGSDFQLTNQWNMTMTKLKCCGFNNYTDFVGSYYSTLYGEIYHSSCCANTTIICTMENARNSTVQGCFKNLESSLDVLLYILGATAAGVGGIEIGAMIVSLYLFCYLDKDAS